MITLKELEEMYCSLGAKFVTPVESINEKLKSIKAFIFDWDGVFNSGMKGYAIHSPYSEADSMGTNLLRFSYWLQNEGLPFVAIITGQENKSAFQLAKREHFHTVYYNFKFKKEALDHIYDMHDIKPEEVAFFFDDILDLSIADKCGLRFLIKRRSSPLFTKYVLENGMCDYITGSESGSQHAIREVTELLIELLGNYDKILNERVSYTNNYQEYTRIRNNQRTLFYIKKDDKVFQKDMRD